MNNTISDEVVRDWLKAREIIGEFLKELVPTLSKQEVEHNAAAIIARLSHANMIIETLELT